MRTLGISVPVPVDSEQVLEAIFEGLLLREQVAATAQQMVLFDDLLQTQKKKLHSTWDISKDREKRSRTMFAQETIKFEDVATEVKAVRCAIGTNIDVKNFTKDTLLANKASISEGWPDNCRYFGIAQKPERSSRCTSPQENPNSKHVLKNLYKKVNSI